MSGFSLGFESIVWLSTNRPLSRTATSRWFSASKTVVTDSYRFFFYSIIPSSTLQHHPTGRTLWVKILPAVFKDPPESNSELQLFLAHLSRPGFKLQPERLCRLLPGFFSRRDTLPTRTATAGEENKAPFFNMKFAALPWCNILLNLFQKWDLVQKFFLQTQGLVPPWKL